MSTHHRALFAALTASALWLSPSAARAQQPVDDASRAAARGVAEEALGRFDKGDYAGALVLFDKADAIVHAPTMGLMAARCLEKLGRWVEAAERYLAVTQARLDAGATEAQRKAQASAEAERDTLLPRIPSLVIVLEGAALEGARATVDGKLVPPVLIGVKRPTDPGAHHVEVTRGGVTAAQDVALAAGETRTITLRLAAGASPAPLSPAAPLAPLPPPRAPEPDSSGSTLRTLGFVGVGVGGAAIVAGAITGGMAVAARGSLDDKGCVDGLCPRSAEGDVSRYNTLRFVSGGTLIAGLALAAAGVTLVAVAPRHRAPEGRAAIEPWIGAGSAGIRGAF